MHYDTYWDWVRECKDRMGEFDYTSAQYWTDELVLDI